jgi:hypothetical protein
LTRRYLESGLVLVLGAGVSVGSGLPTWKELLERVCVDCLEDRRAGLVDPLDAHNVPLPVIASVLEEWCGSRAAFVRRVRDALYRDFPFFPSGVSSGSQREFVAHVRTTNPTLRSVAAMCATPSGGTAFEPNRRIRALVTFNLDYVLQSFVRARYGVRLLRTIERASAGVNPQKISIYHLHGMLRFDRAADDQAKEASDAVILTEQDYYDFFNTPISLFNYTFLYLLREVPCLFVGLSMNDQNLRRLLHFSKAERLEGLKGEGRTGDDLSTKTQRHFAILRRSGIPDLDRVNEDSLLALGTEVLWVDAHGDIESRLRAVYEAAGADWERVA